MRVMTSRTILAFCIGLLPPGDHSDFWSCAKRSHARAGTRSRLKKAPRHSSYRLMDGRFPATIAEPPMLRFAVQHPQEDTHAPQIPVFRATNSDLDESYTRPRNTQPSACHHTAAHRVQE